MTAALLSGCFPLPSTIQHTCPVSPAEFLERTHLDIMYCLPAEFLERTKREYGDVVGLLMGLERVVLISDPAAAKQVSVDED